MQGIANRRDLAIGRRAAALALALAVALVVPPRTDACPELRGVELLLGDGDERASRALLLGEIHGTREAPEAVATLVCHAAEAGIPLTLALEIPRTEQPRIDAFLSSAAGSGRLLSGVFWQRDYQDGRSSRAMYELIASLRDLDSRSEDLRVIAIDDPGAAGGRDRHMARRLERELSETSGRLVVALTGNIHNRLNRGVRWNADYEPMGYLLKQAKPSRDISSVRLTHSGGDAWICQSSKASECGAQALSGREGEPGVRFFADSDGSESPYTGEWHLGKIRSSKPVIDRSP